MPNEKPSFGRRFIYCCRRSIRDVNWKMAGSFTSATGLGVLMFWIAFHLGQPQQTVVNLLVCGFGCASGWVVGVVFSPYSADPNQTDEEDERPAFAQYQKAVAAFCGGYLISKIDRLLEIAFQKDSWIAQTLLVPRLMLFTTCFLFSAVLVYAVRKYTGDQDEQ